MQNCFFITFAVLLYGAQAIEIDNHVTDGEQCLFDDYWRMGIMYNGSCFYIEKDYRQTFSDAKWYCEYIMDAAVFVPQSIEENNFMMSHTAKTAFTWAGISQKRERNWDQTSRVGLNELKWDDANWSSNAPDQCAVASNIQGKIKLHWTSCKETHFYICEAKNKREVFTEPPPTTTVATTIENKGSEDCEDTETTVTQITIATTTTPRVETLKCDDGWLHFGKWCYFVEKTEKATFDEAKQKCKNKEARIFTPISKEEHNTVMANAVVYAHTWIKIHTYSWSIEQLKWLVESDDPALNGYNYYTSATCSAYYNGNIDSAKYLYYYPCNWKFFYICEKLAVAEYI